MTQDNPYLASDELRAALKGLSRDELMDVVGLVSGWRSLPNIKGAARKARAQSALREYRRLLAQHDQAFVPIEAIQQAPSAHERMQLISEAEAAERLMGRAQSALDRAMRLLQPSPNGRQQ